MNKEIEETRKAQENLKELTAFMETVSKQMRERGLFYIFAVADKKNGAMVTGMECKTSHSPALVTEIVSRMMHSMAKNNMDLRRKLNEETWED